MGNRRVNIVDSNDWLIKPDCLTPDPVSAQGEGSV